MTIDLDAIRESAVMYRANQMQHEKTYDRATALTAAAFLCAEDMLALLPAYDQLRAKVERYRIELRDKGNDLLDIRGALSPSGYPRRVPMEIGEVVAPAVEWLLSELDRVTAERDKARRTLTEARRGLESDGLQDLLLLTTYAEAWAAQDGYPTDEGNKAVGDAARVLYARFDALRADLAAAREQAEQAQDLVEQFRRDLGVWEKRYAEMLAQRDSALQSAEQAHAERDIAVKLERGATEQVVALSEALAETRRERDTAREKRYFALVEVDELRRDVAGLTCWADGEQREDVPVGEILDVLRKPRRYAATPAAAAQDPSRCHSHLTGQPWGESWCVLEPGHDGPHAEGISRWGDGQACSDAAHHARGAICVLSGHCCPTCIADFGSCCYCEQAQRHATSCGTCNGGGTRIRSWGGMTPCRDCNGHGTVPLPVAAPVVPAGATCRAEYPPGRESRDRNPGWHTRIVDCDLPAGHDGDHEETDTGNTWPKAAVPGDGEPQWLPACAECGHRHRWGGECALHPWRDDCGYDAGADCGWSEPLPFAAPDPADTKPRTYRDMPVVNCGTDLSHMAHVYDVDGEKVVCAGLLPHSVPLDAEPVPADGAGAGDGEQDATAKTCARDDCDKPVSPFAATMCDPHIAQKQADIWNARHPVGTPVTYWRGVQRGPGVESVTRSPAWATPSGNALVSVEGTSGGISLTHVLPIDAGPAVAAPDADSGETEVTA